MAFDEVELVTGVQIDGEEEARAETIAGLTKNLPYHSSINGQTFGSGRLDRPSRPSIYINLTADDQGGPTESSLVVVEARAMGQTLEIDAHALFDTLEKQGRVSDYGLHFRTGRVTIRPEAKQILQQVFRLLTEHRDLKLTIEGHTDNVGSPAANQKLSQARGRCGQVARAARRGRATPDCSGFR